MLNLFNWIGVRWGARLAWWLFAVGLPLLALAAGLGAGAWGAWQLGRAPLHTELAQLRETHSETLRLAQQAAGQRIQAAHAKKRQPRAGAGPNRSPSQHPETGENPCAPNCNRWPCVPV